MTKKLMRSPIALCAATYLILVGALVAIYFPYQTDVGVPPPPPIEQQYYEKVYSAEEAKQEAKYVELARKAASYYDVTGEVRKFVAANNLQNARVLEVGAGTGMLQDVVENYTGLDISASARKYFHKPFVQGDARALPFKDNEFDSVWSVWVLEHVPHPELSLREIRRVVKPGGYIYLFPAFGTQSWVAQGYDARPYSDFGAGGKVVKASTLVRGSKAFKISYLAPIRALRLGWWKLAGGETNFHYRSLEPNYQQYWEPDGDAVNSLDNYETYLWFVSRGDTCLNRSSQSDALVQLGQPLEIRVDKPSEIASGSTPR